MKRFINQYNELITGMLSCFDRILFKGYLPLWGDGMQAFLTNQGLRIKDFSKFVQKHSARIAGHAERLAKNSGRPYLYLNGPHRKEAIVQGMIEAEGLQQGLVCVMRAVEPCQSFKMVPGEGRPRLIPARRKCLCFYYYFLDPKLGLVHVRIQSWFPLVIQVCLNGHDILARKLDKHGRVLRIETVINQPREFKVRRQGVREGREVIDWFPLCKGVANRLWRLTRRGTCLVNVFLKCHHENYPELLATMAT